MQTIGLVPGAMKPFHAGHHYLIATAISQCDKVIIFTSLKDRGIIKGPKMFEAWQKVILPLLPDTVTICSVTSPVGSVYKYLEHDGVLESHYRIYGGTEDILRLSKARMLQYYPNLNVMNVAEETPDAFTRGAGYTSIPAKGEWVRESIKAGDQEKFRSFLPDFLKPYASEYLQTLLS